ncbi:MAG: deoxyribodipyrimidine photo-lyase [Phycisphaerae bacterium]|nr:deoxyribodipyrimidine photo-lyase [Phycisphaerae bacterium]
MPRFAWTILSAVCVTALAGCGGAVRYASNLVQNGDKSRGIVYYVGGAGPIGHVGSIDVPRGLSDAGFTGYVEVFPWQTFGAAVDQINISRNRAKALELADMIRRDLRFHPDAPVSLIALSAGSGIVTFALEALPDTVRVRSVVFLGCSLSSHYDLTRALKRVNGRLYCFYSPTDTVLSRIVPYTGTIDRSDATQGVAGLSGFAMPALLGPDTLEQYRKVFNIPYQAEFAAAGYSGEHIDSTDREFIARYVGPLLLDRDTSLLKVASSPVDHVAPRSATTRRGPASRPH